MNLRKINLNLLVILDVLLEERNVSNAAKKLFRTQSAVSISLNQLRSIFKDELLIRQPKGMEPTTYALKLQPELKQVLSHVNKFIDQPHVFDCKSSQRCFSIGVNQMCEQFFIPYLYEYLIQHAPNITLQFSRLAHPIEPTIFKQQGLDLLLTAKFGKLSDQLLYETLFTDPFVYVTRKNNPNLKGKLTLKNFNEIKLISGAHLNKLLQTKSNKEKKYGIKITTPLIVPGFHSAVKILEKSNLAMIMPKSMTLEFASNDDLIICDLPFPMQNIEVIQIWSKTANDDKGLLWLKNVIKTIVAENF